MQCSKCKGQRENKNRRYCRKCHSEYMRNWRKSTPLTAEQKQKDNCRSYAGVYKRRGKIIQLPCEICGDINSEMHHEDYSKPLLVKWLCKIHHNEITAKTNSGCKS